MCNHDGKKKKKKKKKTLQGHYYQSHFSQRKLKITEVRQFAEVL